MFPLAGLFKERISKFGSLISLIAVTAMLALFSLSLPEFLASSPGRVFAAAWAALAIVIFIAHSRHIAAQRRRLSLMGRSAGRPRSPQKETQRAVRPLRS